MFYFKIFIGFVKTEYTTQTEDWHNGKYVVIFNTDQFRSASLFFSSLIYFDVSWLNNFNVYLIERPPWYNWNIVESGVKHHQTNKQTNNLIVRVSIIKHNTSLSKWLICA